MSVRLDHGKDELEEVHEINVTPFIDVMLVLLIIFMVAAPLATVDISVDLPASTAQQQPRPEKPLFLTVKPDLSLSLGDETVSRDQLGAALATHNRRSVRSSATSIIGSSQALRGRSSGIPRRARDS